MRKKYNEKKGLKTPVGYESHLKWNKVCNDATPLSRGVSVKVNLDP